MTSNEYVIETQALSKRYGRKLALDHLDLRVPRGRIHAVVGANGAGKSTLFRILLGFLPPTAGTARILGRDSQQLTPDDRGRIGFVNEEHTLPGWMRVDAVTKMHRKEYARWNQAAFDNVLGHYHVLPEQKISQLSRGERAGFNLALALAQGPELLVLDEPTLGLDILYRKQFYDSLLNDYFDGDRTILVTTHQVEEVEHVLTDLMFIDRGRIVFNSTMEAIEARYAEVAVHPDRLDAARALQPIAERQSFGRSVLLFDGRERAQLAPLGEVRTPTIADLFVAIIGNHAAQAQGAAR
ncbi:MAG TPA: ABC transporter ATP-binding protein [Terriglobales bacterium]|nr:ABC transporter ATP-binding protein [Terriglobales bacterium]